MPVNFLLGTGKIVLGALFSSPFVMVNGAYSIGNGLAKFFCQETLYAFLESRPNMVGFLDA